jgi:hypothetical protein
VVVPVEVSVLVNDDVGVFEIEVVAVDVSVVFVLLAVDDAVLVAVVAVLLAVVDADELALLVNDALGV